MRREPQLRSKRFLQNLLTHRVASVGRVCHSIQGIGCRIVTYGSAAGVPDSELSGVDWVADVEEGIWEHTGIPAMLTVED